MDKIPRKLRSSTMEPKLYSSNKLDLSTIIIMHFHRQTMKPKRVTAPRSYASVVAHFDDLMTGSCNVKIDLDASIRFSKIWNILDWEIHRLMALFDGDNDSTDVLNGAGITLVSDIPIAVELSGSYKQHYCTHFKEMSSTEMEMKWRIDSLPKWYGIIDGHHSHEPNQTLKCETWPMVCIHVLFFPN